LKTPEKKTIKKKKTETPPPAPPKKEPEPNSDDDFIDPPTEATWEALRLKYLPLRIWEKEQAEKKRQKILRMEARKERAKIKEQEQRAKEERKRLRDEKKRQKEDLKHQRMLRRKNKVSKVKSIVQQTIPNYFKSGRKENSGRKLAQTKKGFRPVACKFLHYLNFY